MSAINIYTAGTDLGAIAAAAATAVAAVAGIWGTAWQARKGREAATADLKKSIGAAAENTRIVAVAEDRRAEIAAKRRVYATCLGAFNALMVAVVSHRADVVMAGGIRVARPEAAVRSAQDAVAEVQLIADTPTAGLAGSLLAWYLTFIQDSENGATMDDGERGGERSSILTGRLYDAMRVDLGVAPFEQPGGDAT